MTMADAFVGIVRLGCTAFVMSAIVQTLELGGRSCGTEAEALSGASAILYRPLSS